GRRLDSERVPADQVEQLAPVGSGVRGDGAEGALLKQVPGVVEGRNRGQVDAGDGERASGRECCQGGGHEIADGREQDGGLKRLRRLAVCRSGRGRDEVERETARSRGADSAAPTCSGNR